MVFLQVVSVSILALTLRFAAGEEALVLGRQASNKTEPIYLRHGDSITVYYPYETKQKTISVSVCSDSACTGIHLQGKAIDGALRYYTTTDCNMKTKACLWTHVLVSGWQPFTPQVYFLVVRLTGQYLKVWFDGDFKNFASVPVTQYTGLRVNFNPIGWTGPDIVGDVAYVTCDWNDNVRKCDLQYDCRDKSDEELETCGNQKTIILRGETIGVQVQYYTYYLGLEFTICNRLCSAIKLLGKNRFDQWAYVAYSGCNPAVQPCEYNITKKVEQWEPLGTNPYYFYVTRPSDRYFQIQWANKTSEVVTIEAGFESGNEFSVRQSQNIGDLKSRIDHLRCNVGDEKICIDLFDCGVTGPVESYGFCSTVQTTLVPGAKVAFTVQYRKEHWAITLRFCSSEGFCSEIDLKGIKKYGDKEMMSDTREACPPRRGCFTFGVNTAPYDEFQSGTYRFIAEYAKPYLQVWLRDRPQTRVRVEAPFSSENLRNVLTVKPYDWTTLMPVTFEHTAPCNVTKGEKICDGIFNCEDHSDEFPGRCEKVRFIPTDNFNLKVTVGFKFEYRWLHLYYCSTQKDHQCFYAALKGWNGANELAYQLYDDCNDDFSSCRDAGKVDPDGWKYFPDGERLIFIVKRNDSHIIIYNTKSPTKPIEYATKKRNSPSVTVKPERWPVWNMDINLDFDDVGDGSLCKRAIKYCDGIQDCSNGADEDPRRCKQIQADVRDGYTIPVQVEYRVQHQMIMFFFCTSTTCSVVSISRQAYDAFMFGFIGYDCTVHQAYCKNVTQVDRFNTGRHIDLPPELRNKTFDFRVHRNGSVISVFILSKERDAIHLDFPHPGPVNMTVRPLSWPFPMRTLIGPAFLDSPRFGVVDFIVPVGEVRYDLIYDLRDYVLSLGLKKTG